MSDNPPAFPVLIVDRPEELTHFNGMTLRDYFAAKALQGAISGCAARGEVSMYSDLAGLSYDMADAMMKARES
jgi:hypothetical protein